MVEPQEVNNEGTASTFVSADDMAQTSIAPTPPSQPSPAAGAGGNLPELAEQLRNGATSHAHWFYWITGLSIINSLIAFFNGTVSFIVGLGITQAVDAVTMEASDGNITLRLIGLSISILIACGYLIFGRFAAKMQTWAFVTGIIFYALDTVLCLIFQDWFSAAFHAWVLYNLFRGLQACRSLKQVEAAILAQSSPNTAYTARPVNSL